VKPYLSLLITITTIILISCSLETNSADPLSISTPDIGVTQRDGYLEITAPKGWNSFKTNKPISLMIRNTSDKQIVSDQDFDARIFVFSGNKWIEVANKTVYSDDKITLDPDKNFDPTKIKGIFVFPDIADYSIPQHLRIFLVGTLIERGKESQKIATYIDLTLSP
jgi:hypothetical protein